jgi:hypothetical protein
MVSTATGGNHVEGPGGKLKGRMIGRWAVAAWALCASAAWGAAARSWALAASPHFEVYSQAGPEGARASLAWLERLRAWVTGEMGLQPDRLRPARVIGFASEAEYAPFRKDRADAYYIGTEGRDYIVMVAAGPNELPVAAHEYAHLMMHSAGLRLPPWLDEGLSDVFGAAAAGGRHPEHVELLRRRGWIPIEELLQMRPSGDSSLFYAESWALAGMLAFSPEYRPKLRVFVAALASGTPGAEAFGRVYGKTAGQLEPELRNWLAKGADGTLSLPAAAEAPRAVEVPPSRLRLLLATLLLDSGERGRAEAVYRDLLRENPEVGDIHAGLGMLAHYAGDGAASREHWKRAVELGAEDDALLFRYAVLAGNEGRPASEIRPVASSRAIRSLFDNDQGLLALRRVNQSIVRSSSSERLELSTQPKARASSTASS